MMNVFALAKEMVERVGIFKEKYDKMGQLLDNVKKEYDDGRKRLEVSGHTITNTANKLIKLGTKNSEKHPIELLEE